MLFHTSYNHSVDVNTTTFKKIINVIHRSTTKLSIIAIIAIPMIMTISMHGKVLALASITPVASVDDPGYQLTVNVPSYPSGTSTLGISITTRMDIPTMQT